MKEKTIEICVGLQSLKDKVKRGIKEKLNNNNGEGIVPSLIFMGIIIIAVVALKPVIEGIFTALGTSFKTFIETKTNGIFG